MKPRFKHVLLAALSVLLCAAPVAAKEKKFQEGPGSAGIALDLKNMKAWQVTVDGVMIRMTEDGKRALHDILGANAGSVAFYVGPTQVSTIKVANALQSDTLRASFREEEKEANYKLLQAHTVCEARDQCYIERGTLRLPAK